MLSAAHWQQLISSTCLVLMHRLLRCAVLYSHHTAGLPESKAACSNPAPLIQSMHTTPTAHLFFLSSSVSKSVGTTPSITPMMPCMQREGHTRCNSC
jgi:hypothetical protein